MKTRIAHMLDTKTFEPRFGVQVQTRNGWALVAVDGEVQALTEKAEAERLRAELRRRKLASNLQPATR